MLCAYPPTHIHTHIHIHSTGLGLPQRYLIRAAPELPNPLMFDNDYYAESVLL